MAKKTKRGGQRDGAGRPRKEPTVLKRIPVSLVEKVNELIAKLKK